MEYFDHDSDKGGVMTFGEADTSNCDSNWTKIAVPGAFTGVLTVER